MIRRIMSRLETQPGTRIEGLGGSFSRNVRLGEDGLGMRWNTPGETFPLAAIIEDAKGAGTSIAPGTFEAIYINLSDALIVKIDQEGNAVGYLDEGAVHVVNSSLEDWTSSTKEMKIDENIFKEAVLKKWGHFSTFDGYTSTNPNMLNPIPDSDIEDRFNALQAKWKAQNPQL